MFIKQLSLFVENQPGSLSKVCKVLKDGGFNIRTLSLADTPQYGILRLLIREHEAVKAALEAAGFIVKITDVFALSVPDRPGGLADILAIFDRYGVSIEYMYAFSFGRGDRAIMVFRITASDEVFEKLRKEPLEIVTAEELFA